MTVRPELTFEGAPPGPSIGSALRVRRMVIGTAVLLALVIGTAVQFSAGPTSQAGRQAKPDESIVIERAALEGWVPFAPITGEQREGFPSPMVRVTERVCIGFARVDFGPEDLRPSLARCERRPTGNMAANEMRLLVAVTSGLDTWHFIEVSDQIESISVRLTSGETLSGERILLSGSAAALRLENGRDLASVEWTTPSARYRCVPDPTAWRTSVFCAD